MKVLERVGMQTGMQQVGKCQDAGRYRSERRAKHDGDTQRQRCAQDLPLLG